MRIPVFKKNVVALMLMLAIASCTSAQGWIISGQTLDAVGKQFLATGAMYDSLLESKAVTAAEYRTWAEFANKFKMVYPAAVQAWKSAANAQQAGDATDAIIAVKNELITFYLAALAKKGAK